MRRLNSPHPEEPRRGPDWISGISGTTIIGLFCATVLVVVAYAYIFGSLINEGVFEVRYHDSRHPSEAQTPCKQSFYSGDGARVGRTSSDDCWPLRRADGTTWADSGTSVEETD